MRQLTAPELAAWLADPARGNPVVVDVREPWELEVCRIAGAKPMPLRSVPARYAELAPEAETVIVCHHGARSYQVAMFLESQGFGHVYNLYGGLAAWAQQVDPAMPTY